MSSVEDGLRDVQDVQRRTLRVLLVCQALGGLGLTIGIAVASVLARDVSGSEELAGTVQTAQVVGTALASYLLARLMAVAGRRPGMVLGYLLGALGAATCVVGGVVGAFPVLVLGGFLLGANGATNLQARYAATDLALPDHRARAVSTVLWATTVGAVLGPNLVGPAGRLAVSLGLPRLTGPFLLSGVVIVVAAVVAAVALRPDPLLTALAATGQEPSRPATDGDGGRPSLGPLVRATPAIGWAVLAMSASHAVMVAVMVMTPLHMDHGGARLEVIGLVVSIHVLGMFALSPLMGWVADRAGRTVLLSLGGALLLVACGLSGSSPDGASARIGVGLFLLGVGWSACMVASSTLLTDVTPLPDRPRVQGGADTVMNLAAAVGGALGGVVVGAFGYAVLNAGAAILVGGVLLAALRLRVRPPAVGAAV